MAIEDKVANPISASPHLLSILRTGLVFIDDIPINDALIYLIDQVNPVALDSILRGFNMDNQGWDLGATPDAQKREIIKSALPTHLKAGTVFSVREVFRLAGHPAITILEGTDIDNPFVVNDTNLVGGGLAISNPHGWWQYAIIIDVSQSTTTLTESLAAQLDAVLRSFAAPARCERIFTATFIQMDETVTLGEVPTIVAV